MLLCQRFWVYVCIYFHFSHLTAATDILSTQGHIPHSWFQGVWGVSLLVWGITRNIWFSSVGNKRLKCLLTAHRMEWGTASPIPRTLTLTTDMQRPTELFHPDIVRKIQRNPEGHFPLKLLLKTSGFICNSSTEQRTWWCSENPLDTSEAWRNLIDSQNPPALTFLNLTCRLNTCTLKMFTSPAELFEFMGKEWDT